jgi:hypothetical protein
MRISKIKEQIHELQEIFNYAEFCYKQPRNSNEDNSAFITICQDIGKVIKTLKEDKID